MGYILTTNLKKSEELKLNKNMIIPLIISMTNHLPDNEDVHHDALSISSKSCKGLADNG